MSFTESEIDERERAALRSRLTDEVFEVLLEAARLDLTGDHIVVVDLINELCVLAGKDRPSKAELKPYSWQRLDAVGENHHKRT